MVDLILHIGLKDYDKSLKRIIGYEKGVARKVHLSLQFTTVFISHVVMLRHQLNSGDRALEKGHRLSKINIIKAEVSSPWGDQADWYIGFIKFRSMKPSYSETGGVVLTPDFSKSNVVWSMGLIGYQLTFVGIAGKEADMRVWWNKGIIKLG